MAGSTLFAGQYGEAFLGWESNGPGESWYHDILRQDYRFVYFQRQLGKRGEVRTKQYGWRSDRRNKRILLSALARELYASRIDIPSKPGLREMLEYVYFPNGGIGPGLLEDETTGARESHGDRVIAYAGGVFMIAEAPEYEVSRPSYPTGSLGELLGHTEVMENME